MVQKGDADPPRVESSYAVRGRHDVSIGNQRPAAVERVPVLQDGHPRKLVDARLHSTDDSLDLVSATTLCEENVFGIAYNDVFNRKGEMSQVLLHSVQFSAGLRGGKGR